jgi:hypothetical protein
MLAAARYMALMGDDAQITQAKMRQCLTFHLDYDITSSYWDGGTSPLLAGDMTVSSLHAKIEWNNASNLEGTLPLTATGYKWFDYLCGRWGGTATPTQPADVILGFNLNPTYVMTATGPVATFHKPDVKLLFSLGTITTTNGCGLTGFSGSFYRDMFALGLPFLPYKDGEVVVETPEWEFLGGSPWAKVDDSHVANYGSGSNIDRYTTHLKLTLYHDPA